MAGTVRGKYIYVLLGYLYPARGRYHPVLYLCMPGVSLHPCRHGTQHVLQSVSPLWPYMMPGLYHLAVVAKAHTVMSRGKLELSSHTNIHLRHSYGTRKTYLMLFQKRQVQGRFTSGSSLRYRIANIQVGSCKIISVAPSIPPHIRLDTYMISLRPFPSLLDR